MAYFFCFNQTLFSKVRNLMNFDCNIAFSRFLKGYRYYTITISITNIVVKKLQMQVIM